MTAVNASARPAAQPTSEPLLSVEHLSTTFETAAGPVRAVRDISFEGPGNETALDQAASQHSLW